MVKVTQQDIATVMGVSVMTVSNAFNHPDQLSADLRRRVLERAAKMGYTGPDAVARQLRSGRTNTFAVVFEERLSYAFSDPFSVAWLTAFSEVMERRRAGIMLLSVPARDAEALAAVQDAAIDGIAGLCGDQPAMARARERGLPTVYCTMGQPVGAAPLAGDYVAIDDYAAALEAGRYIARLGHTRVSLLIETAHPGQPALTEHQPAELSRLVDDYAGVGYFDTFHRIRGVIDGLGDATVSVVVTGVNSRASGREAGALVLDRLNRPTAVVAVSDVLALGFMDSCRQRGVQPGRDVSVVGFDDLPESAAAGLTTIRQPIREKGRLAAELLLDPERSERRIILPHELVVRSSTTPVA
ncbi:LacI family DNA-binding transcriptional regulator [Propionicimonas sp.]|uniref:LacI family DNA-binding transcriptional regulator n=1 Tax=Propionicimonas sp. TaxID=1955623 RepID=UPI0039E25B6F